MKLWHLLGGYTYEDRKVKIFVSPAANFADKVAGDRHRLLFGCGEW